jgi:hypothetical protein
MALSVAAAGAACPARAVILYTLKDLAILPSGTASVGWAVNDSDQVAGRSGGHAFLSGPRRLPGRAAGQSSPLVPGSSGVAVAERKGKGS